MRTWIPSLAIVIGLVVGSACTGSSSDGQSQDGAPTSLVTIAGEASPTADGAPIDVSVLQGLITFSDGTDDVWVARADGSHARPVTRSPAMEFDPTWAPDGSRIAYRHQVGDDGATEIFSIAADGSQVRRLTMNRVADWGPEWSPDGMSIAWNSMSGTGGYGMLGYQMQPDGSDPRRLSHHDVEYPAWSPDGRRIAFMAQEPGATGSDPDYNVFVMDRDGSNVQRLTRTPGEDGWPAWSPDGNHIVFASTADDCSNSDAPDCRTTGDIGPWFDVWVVNPNGSGLHRVTYEFGQFFAWSPDGQEILVSGADGLYVIRPDGSGMADVPIDGAATPLFPDWIAG